MFAPANLSNIDNLCSVDRLISPGLLHTCSLVDSLAGFGSRNYMKSQELVQNIFSES